MLSRSRLYERQLPNKDARLFLIFCEGTVTEPNYFKYFNELNSQIKIVPVPGDPQGNNSPEGLLAVAKVATLKSADNSNPEYDLQGDDEVWFVIDTDQWAEAIATLRTEAAEQGWHVAQSNPCFEVWLYHHFHAAPASFEGHELSINWKEGLNGLVAGGFDHRKHPIYIQAAMVNARTGLIDLEMPSCTEVYLLAERFYPLVAAEIEEALQKI